VLFVLATEGKKEARRMSESLDVRADNAGTFTSRRDKFGGKEFVYRPLLQKEHTMPGITL
jgi:hypothetical protein